MPQVRRIPTPINLNRGSQIPMGGHISFPTVPSSIPPPMPSLQFSLPKVNPQWLEFARAMIYLPTGLHAYSSCKSIKKCQERLASCGLLNAIYHSGSRGKWMGLQMESDHLRWTCCQTLEECIFHFLYSKLLLALVFCFKGTSRVSAYCIYYEKPVLLWSAAVFTAILSDNRVIAKCIVLQENMWNKNPFYILAAILSCYFLLMCSINVKTKNTKKLDF